jgi:GMP synthase (glutamine-hydrolysing)
VQWNSDVVSVVPEGATVLATAPDGTAQAIRYADRAWGVQFHPETSPAIFNGWTVDHRSAHVPSGVDLDATALEVATSESQLRAAWEPLVTRFATFVRQAAEDRNLPARSSPATMTSSVRVSS